MGPTSVLAVRQLALRTICHPLVGRALAWIYGNQIPFRAFKIDTRGIAPGIVARIYWGKYERAEVDFVRDYLQPDLDIVELGGSLGIVSLQLLEKRSDGCKLVTVEANPELIPFWKRNMAQVDPSNVELVNAAISYSGLPEVSLSLGQDSLSAAIGQSERTMNVASTTLSDILTAHQIGDFVLVADIEGAESGILCDDARALESCHQIIIELHDTDTCAIVDAVKRIEELGFVQTQNRGPVFVFQRLQRAMRK